MDEQTVLLKTNWNDVKYFLFLARHQRLTKVAELFQTSHVTVSNRISSLEDSLKVKIFTRTPGGYVLTEQGKDLYRYAERVEHLLLRGIKENIQASSARPRVRLGVTEGFGNYYLASRLALAARELSIDVDYISLPKITQITSRTVDISISLEKPDNESIIRKRLSDYHLGIFASSTYLLQNGPVTADALVRHQWIGYIDTLLFTEELKYHEEISTDLNYSFRSTSIVAQLEAAKQGLGLAILPLYMVCNEPALQRVLPEMGFRRTYWMSSNTDLHRFPPVKQLWQTICKMCEDDHSILLGSA